VHVAQERTFTVVFGGTSVTAGHDNAYEQAYPFQFERMVQCTFAAAGIQLKVRSSLTHPPIPPSPHPLLPPWRKMTQQHSAQRPPLTRACSWLPLVSYEVTMCAIVRETCWSVGPHTAHLVLLTRGFGAACTGAQRGAGVQSGSVLRAVRG
jgi:hypothetical protein